jgi:peptide/nickel transport system substrate-binding protein
VVRTRCTHAVVAAIVAAVAVMASPAVGGAASSSKPSSGGNVTIIAPDPPSFNVGAAASLSAVSATLYQVYGGLIKLDPNNQNAPGPGLAKSVTGTPDGKTWTITLFPNIKFTDGTPLDAAAIKSNFDYHADPANASGAVTFASNVASWDVSDPLVAKATLKTADAAFPVSLVWRLDFMMSPTALAKYGKEYGTSVDKVVGAGPFTLTSWTRGNQLVFTKNANFFQKGKPYLDTVTVKVITDDTTALNTMTTHGADLLYQTRSSDMENQAVAAGCTVNHHFYDSVSSRYAYVFNLNRPPFNDPLARQAVSMAIDPKKYAAATNNPAASAIYDKTNPYYSKEGDLPAYNQSKAQQLINQWSAKNGGQPLTFTFIRVAGFYYLGGYAEVEQTALSGYQNLKVNVQTVASSAALGPLGRNGDFDLYPTALGGPDPTIPLNSALITNGARNFGKYSNPQMDAALLAGASQPAVKDRKSAYVDVQKLMIQDLPMWVMPINLFPTSRDLICNKAVKDVTGMGFALNTDEMWLSSKK